MSPGVLSVRDLTVRIYRGWPPIGEIVAESIAGSGSVERDPVIGLGLFKARFGLDTLPVGEYYVVWNADTLTSARRYAFIFHNPAAYSIGRGEPANAYLWNPKGGQGWPDNLVPVKRDMAGTGPSGLNFTLFGEFVATPPGCPANCTGDLDPLTGKPRLDIADFTCFQNAFALGDLAKADVGADGGGCTADGRLSISDFSCFQNLFAIGCPQARDAPARPPRPPACPGRARGGQAPGLSGL